ncbi:molecular chaperone [Pseudomonas simiae]|uniref:fimbrial biogenesis chaperone n=1 Tax=Pseudomonas simiae TaxID=321846 RepID=UPI0018E35415|nr:molecular chaperone [Pseudomonas simiae]QQD30029.1 molecular chaperone [Pseudomonas simiae]
MSIVCAYKKRLGAWVFLLSCAVSTATYAGGVGVGTTRVIYPSDRAEVSMSVSNTDADNAYLIQSWIETPDGKIAADFLMTPPLFKIKRKSENTLRLMYTGAALPEDRETLFLVNVKSIPSKSKVAMQKGQSTLQLAVVSRIKLFYRPAALVNGSRDAALRIEAERAADKVVFKNPTPYFINLTNISIGAHELKSTMVAPFSEERVDVQKGTNGELAYSYLNDYGAVVKIK